MTSCQDSWRSDGRSMTTDSLFKLIQANRLDEFRQVLSGGADPNETNKTKQPLLHFAAARGRAGFVEALLEAGAGVESYNGSKQTPLMAAVLGKDGTLETVKRLVEWGANVRVRDPRNYGLLHMASEAGKPDVLEYLVSQGLNPYTVSDTGESLIHSAINGRAQSKDCVAYLLSLGLPVHLSTAQGLTTLHHAAFAEVPEILALLLAQPGVNAEMEDEAGMRPLHRAAQADALTCLNLLLKQGVDPNPFTASGYSPLHVAAENGNYRCVSALIAGGADPNRRTAKTQNGGGNERTPLHAAVNRAAFKWPVDPACQESYKETFRGLLAGGAELNTQDAHGKTPLECAFGRDEQTIKTALLTLHEQIRLSQCVGGLEETSADDVPGFSL